MNLNESIVEAAALEWLLLRQGAGGKVGYNPRLVLGELAAELARGPGVNMNS